MNKNTHSSKCLASQGDRLSPESWQGVLYHQTFLYKNLGFKIETVSPLHTLRRALCGGEELHVESSRVYKIKIHRFRIQGPKTGVIVYVFIFPWV